MGTYYYSTVSRYGFGEEAALILDAWKTGDRKKACDFVSDAMLDSLSVWGSPGQGKSIIDQYLAQGVDTPILLFPPKASREVVRETIESLSPGG